MTMTPDEQARFYGATAAEWLSRWDSNETVWSVEMGGIGPGYEQAIQITAAEAIRHLLAHRYDASSWDDPATWAVDSLYIEKAVASNPEVKKLHLSGGQFSAAINIALALYRRTPVVALTDPAVKDRLIMVNRVFP